MSTLILVRVFQDQILALNICTFLFYNYEIHLLDYYYYSALYKLQNNNLICTRSRYNTRFYSEKVRIHPVDDSFTMKKINYYYSAFQK